MALIDSNHPPTVQLSIGLLIGQKKNNDSLNNKIVVFSIIAVVYCYPPSFNRSSIFIGLKKSENPKITLTSTRYTHTQHLHTLRHVKSFSQASCLHQQKLHRKHFNAYDYKRHYKATQHRMTENVQNALNGKSVSMYLIVSRA